MRSLRASRIRMSSAFPAATTISTRCGCCLSLARHPNVGAVLAVGLGCEYTQPELLGEPRPRIGPAGRVVLHSAKRRHDRQHRERQGDRRRLPRASCNSTPRVEMSLADLVVGSECGGSDFTSGLAGNPAVGRVFDRIVDAGGSAVFEEVVEMIGLRDVLVDRAANEAARDAGRRRVRQSGRLLPERAAVFDLARQFRRRTHHDRREEPRRARQERQPADSGRAQGRPVAALARPVAASTPCPIRTSCSTATPTPTTPKGSWT